MKRLKQRGFRRVGGKRGFTLIELLIVMSIIAVLVAVVALSLTGFLGAGKEQVCQADQRSLQSAVLAYYTGTNGNWPSTTQPTTGTPQAINFTLLTPTYVLEKPGSDTNCGWYVKVDGIVCNHNANCPCKADVPSCE